MSLSHTDTVPPFSTGTRPTTPPFARAILRVTGLLAIMLFLTPTIYVVKYFGWDHSREQRLAARVTMTPLTPGVSVETVAPPFKPLSGRNGAAFYAAAIQSYANRLAASPAGRLPSPTLGEVEALFAGAHCADSRFFLASAGGTNPILTFQDPERGSTAEAYRLPRSSHERYRYLGAAAALARALAGSVQSAPAGDPHRKLVAQAIIRFGAALGHERATRTHLELSYLVQKIGLGLLASNGDRSIERYVDALQLFEESVQSKYAALCSVDPDNIALQEKIALHDHDPMWRREAVWALGASISAPGASWHRPLETLTGKAALAQIATQDADEFIRAAASETLGGIARHSAIIRR